MTEKSSIPLKFIPLGGLGEIGLNMMAFEYDGNIIIVDSGLMFPEDYMLGVDIVIPDFDYIKRNHTRVRAIIFTHSHEDHIGAIPFLIKEVSAPIYGTGFTLGMIESKLTERNLMHRAELIKIAAGDVIDVNPFEVEFISVSHSVVDGVGLAIQTPVGLVVHTGDFKIGHGTGSFDMTDLGRFAHFGEKGVLALLSDSTNVEKEGYTISEMKIGNALDDVIKSSHGRIIVASFASNIPRIAQIVDIARKRGKKLLFNGRSMVSSVNLATELGFLKFPPEMEISLSDLSDYPDDEVIMITTGSQGEPLSALYRISTGVHKQIKVQDGDTVILSSKFIPGNEKAIYGIINRLYRQGADVIYEKISAIHVSGHAFREELKLMLELTKPKYFIPIHGEYRHLVLHGRLARQMGMASDRVIIAEDGDVVYFDETGAEISDHVETGRVLVDGKGVGDVGRSVLKERRNLSEHGMVVVSLILDNETGVVLEGPFLSSKGFVFETEKGHLLKDAECVILEVIEDFDMERPDRVEKIRYEIQKALKQYFKFVIQRRPVIMPVILEV